MCTGEYAEQFLIVHVVVTLGSSPLCMGPGVLA